MRWWKAKGLEHAAMALVKQARVLRNVLVLWFLCALVLWLVRTRLWEYRDALLLGLTAGAVYGPLHWWQLSRKVARRGRRFERNKVFVHYLNIVEVALSAVAYNHYLAIPLALALLVSLLLGFLSGHWWTVLAGSFGVAGGGVLAGCIIRYERSSGPLYYQYNSRTWSGAEGMLYQVGTVIQPLTPTGKIEVRGELWNTVSLSGETIEVGDRVEVISIERLTLYVDRLPEVSKSV
jgi:membrane protein implicated in regulation of membrane protease activity